MQKNASQRPSGPAFPGSAGVSPAPEAAKMAALPGGSGMVMPRDCIPAPRELMARAERDNVYLIDVRTVQEYAQGHIPGF